LFDALAGLTTARIIRLPAAPEGSPPGQRARLEQGGVQGQCEVARLLPAPREQPARRREEELALPGVGNQPLRAEQQRGVEAEARVSAESMRAIVAGRGGVGR
jgi:hypothetical protein